MQQDSYDIRLTSKDPPWEQFSGLAMTGRSERVGHKSQGAKTRKVLIPN